MGWALLWLPKLDMHCSMLGAAGRAGPAAGLPGGRTCECTPPAASFHSGTGLASSPPKVEKELEQAFWGGGGHGGEGRAGQTLMVSRFGTGSSGRPAHAPAST